MHSTPPGWIPHGNPSIDPNVNLTLDDITDDQEVKQEYIEAVKEQQEEIEILKAHSHPAKDMSEMKGYQELMARIEKMEKNYGNN